MNLRIFLLLAGFMYELIRSCSEYRNGNEMDVDTEAGDDLLNARPGKTDLVIGETGETKRATGEKFSPPNEGQNREYSKNYNNNIDLVIDRRKNPGIERPYDLVCSPLSPPESFLRSVEMVETKVNIGLDTESEEKSGGDRFFPVFSDGPFFLRSLRSLRSLLWSHALSTENGISSWSFMHRNRQEGGLILPPGRMGRLLSMDTLRSFIQNGGDFRVMNPYFILLMIPANPG